MVLDDETLKPALLIPMEKGKSRVVVTEGKYHQVRRMMAIRGMDVTYLKRIREGKLALGSLEVGKWKELEPGEEAELLGK